MEDINDKLFKNIKQSLNHLQWCDYVQQLFKSKSKTMNLKYINIMQKFSQFYAYVAPPLRMYDIQPLHMLITIGFVSVKQEVNSLKYFRLTPVGRHFTDLYLPKVQKINVKTMLRDTINRAKHTHTENKRLPHQIREIVVGSKFEFEDYMDRLSDHDAMIMDLNDLKLRTAPQLKHYEKTQSLQDKFDHRTLKIRILHRGFQRNLLQLIRSSNLQTLTWTKLQNLEHKANKVTKEYNLRYFRSHAITEIAMIQFLDQHHIWKLLDSYNSIYIYHKLVHDMF